MSLYGLETGAWFFRPSYPALGPRPPKNIQPAQPPPTQSPVTIIMCTLLSMVYGLFKPCWLTHATCTCFKETALLLNKQLSCFVNFILCPTNKYMFKVNNEKIRLICWMCSKLKLNATWHRSGVFIVNFEQSQYINIVFLFLTLNKHLSIGWERQVIMFWKHKKQLICFVIKVARSISFSDEWTDDHTMNILQGRKKLSYGGGEGGRLRKNVSHHGWPTRKNKKKHWLKRPKAVPQNEIWTKI